MPGKTISAHADEETARLVEHLARLEDRSPSQIAAAALALYVGLPAVAHASLRHVQALGTPDDYARMTREVARAMLDARHQITHRRMIDSMEYDVSHLETEEDVLAEAVRLTTDRPPRQRTIRKRDGEKAADTEARPRRRRFWWTSSGSRRSTWMPTSKKSRRQASSRSPSPPSPLRLLVFPRRCSIGGIRKTRDRRAEITAAGRRGRPGRAANHVPKGHYVAQNRGERRDSRPEATPRAPIFRRSQAFAL